MVVESTHAVPRPRFRSIGTIPSCTTTATTTTTQSNNINNKKKNAGSSRKRFQSLVTTAIQADRLEVSQSVPTGSSIISNKSEQYSERSCLARTRKPFFVYYVALILLIISFFVVWMTFLWTDTSYHSYDITLDRIRIAQQQQQQKQNRALPVQVVVQQQRKTGKILTLYMESSYSTMEDNSIQPIPVRQTSAKRLHKIEYHNVTMDCTETGGVVSNLPVDNFPHKDPYLPWIHDYVVQNDAVHFIAQNKRRCETGEDKASSMKYWEPQLALFQSIPIVYNGSHYRLSSYQEATAPETRFLCHFHSNNNGHNATTVSQYPFNYEYVLWRKHKLPMYKIKGPDVATIELSQLLFSCPIPVSMQETSDKHLYLDLVPIRTPPRYNTTLFVSDQIGPYEWESRISKHEIFHTKEHFGTKHILPAIQDSGRWANLPICPIQQPKQHHPRPNTKEKMHYLVACTWTSASYMRRGDVVTINDAAARLREWIVFHRLVGLDHIYVYDNTPVKNNNNNNNNNTQDGTASRSPLRMIAEAFPDFVTYRHWPYTVCSNNRPNHKNPGERSSQYAADASCRTRYGSQTEWMTFIDTDEYLVPMRNNETWIPILQDMEHRSIDVVKLRSSRGRPRIEYMERLLDQSTCSNPNGHKSRLPEESCVGPRRNETFLRVYNCDYIRHPRPERFQRAQKQIFRPANVLSHFVHYSPVTTQIATYYIETANQSQYQRHVQERDYGDIFLEELTEGVLIHTKAVLPYETTTRSAICHNYSKHTCMMGYACPDTTAFNDELHHMNIFHDEYNNYCNCWVDDHLENFWIPKLEYALQNL